MERHHARSQSQAAVGPSGQHDRIEGQRARCHCRCGSGRDGVRAGAEPKRHRRHRVRAGAIAGRGPARRLAASVDPGDARRSRRDRTDHSARPHLQRLSVSRPRVAFGGRRIRPQSDAGRIPLSLRAAIRAVQTDRLDRQGIRQFIRLRRAVLSCRHRPDRDGGRRRRRGELTRRQSNDCAPIT